MSASVGYIKILQTLLTPDLRDQPFFLENKRKVMWYQALFGQQVLKISLFYRYLEKLFKGLTTYFFNWTVYWKKKLKCTHSWGQHLKFCLIMLFQNSSCFWDIQIKDLPFRSLNSLIQNLCPKIIYFDWGSKEQHFCFYTFYQKIDR